MNSSNATFYRLEEWFSIFGYTHIADIITAYIITPVWLLTIILSMFSLFILLKPSFFASNFFKYMRLYVTICLILSLLSLTTILATTRTLFSITNPYKATFYCIYAFSTAQNILFLFSSCIEICLVVDRISNLLPTSFKRIKLIGFKKFFFILFIICILIHIPGIFLFEPAFADIQLDQNTLFRIWFIAPTTYSNSLSGQILNFLGYILRDVLPMIFKLIINSLSVYLVRKYVRNKHKISSAGTTRANMINFDRNQTYISLVMSKFSLLEHILYIAAIVLFFFILLWIVFFGLSVSCFIYCH